MQLIQIIQKKENKYLSLALVLLVGVMLGIAPLFIGEQWLLILSFSLLVVFFCLFVIKVDYKILSLILILSAYINLIKPIFSIRYAPIFIDLIIPFFLIKIFLDAVVLKKNYLLQSPAIEFTLGLFFLISIIQIFNPNIPTLKAGLEGFRKTTYQMLAVFLGIYCIKNISEIEKIGKYICYAAIPILLYGIKQFFFFSPFDLQIIKSNFGGFGVYRIAGHMRAISIFSGPFQFGMFSCFISLWALYFYFKKKRFFYLVLFLVSVITVFLSMTRINIVALSVSILFFLWFARPEKHRLLKKINIFLALICLILVILSSQKFSPIVKVFKTLESVTEDPRFLARFGGYKYMLDSFVKNPIVGYGMGSAGDTMARIYDMNIHFTSHNMWFKILMETGILGFIAYISFFIIWFKNAFKLFRIKNIEVRNWTILIVCIVFIMLINGLTGSSVEAYPINLYIWFFMGTLIALFNNQQEIIKQRR